MSTPSSTLSLPASPSATRPAASAPRAVARGASDQRADLAASFALVVCSNVSGAQRELLKYYASVSSNRWLMVKIFGVLIIFVSRLTRSVDALRPNS